MRCPGTPNIKTGRIAEIVVPSREIMRGLASRLVVGTPPAVFNEPEPGSYPPGTPWQTAFVELTRKAQVYLTDGWVEPGRHERAWHTAKVLFEKGIERAQVEAAIRYGNSLKGAENALSEEELLHAVDTAQTSV
jgi:hypothetical protein